MTYMFTIFRTNSYFRRALENKKRDLVLELRLIHEHQDYFRKSIQTEAAKRFQHYRECKMKVRSLFLNVHKTNHVPKYNHLKLMLVDIYLVWSTHASFCLQLLVNMNYSITNSTLFCVCAVLPNGLEVCFAIVRVWFQFCSLTSWARVISHITLSWLTPCK